MNAAFAIGSPKPWALRISSKLCEALRPGFEQAQFPAPSSMNVRLTSCSLALSFLAMGIAHGASKEDDTPTILFKRAEALVARGEQGEALAKYRVIASKYREHSLAPEARFRAAQLLHANREFIDAFDEYQGVLTKFPQSDLFTKVIEGQMQIAEQVLEEYDISERAGRPRPGKNVPNKELASDLFRIILENAKHTELSPKIHYARSVALEREQLRPESIESHNLFVENYPEHYLADDAMFQASYISYKIARDGNNPDPGAVSRAEFGFEEFLMRFPESEKTAQARYCLDEMREMRRKLLYAAARQYEKVGKKVAAAKMYKEALSIGDHGAEPNRTLEKIQRRIDKTGVGE
jgi:outer membrane protein assembly factor BamD